MTTTVIIPVTCDYHEVHAVLGEIATGVMGCIALYCSDCNEEFPME